MAKKKQEISYIIPIIPPGKIPRRHGAGIKQKNRLYTQPVSSIEIDLMPALGSG